MNLIIYNCFYFSIEFLKLYLLSRFLFNIRQKKRTQIMYVLCIVLLSVFSLLFEISNYTVIYGIISILILMYGSENNKKLYLFPMTYILISIVDIMIFLMVIKLFDLTIITENGDPYISAFINSISFTIIIFVIIIMKYKRKKAIDFEIHKYFWLYFLAGITISLFLTCLQISEIGKTKGVYYQILFWGLCASAVLFIILCILFFIKSNENEYLLKEKEVCQRLLQIQQEYYQMLLEKEKQTNAFRHDIRKHVFCMQSLVQEKDYEELEKYLEKMGDNIRTLYPKIQTGNALITAIVNDLVEKFPDVECVWSGFLIEDLQLTSYDICMVFYNVFVNAFEAANQAKRKEVKIQIRFMNHTMHMRIENTYLKVLISKDREYISIKTDKGHGYGIKNIKEGISKSNGIYQTEVTDEKFITEIIFPEIVIKNGTSGS